MFEWPVEKIELKNAELTFLFENRNNRVGALENQLLQNLTLFLEDFSLLVRKSVMFLQILGFQMILDIYQSVSLNNGDNVVFGF